MPANGVVGRQGKEFVALLPEADAAGAEGAAERMRAAIATSPSWSAGTTCRSRNRRHCFHRYCNRRISSKPTSRPVRAEA